MIQPQPLARHDDFGVIEYSILAKNPYFDKNVYFLISFATLN